MQFELRFFFNSSGLSDGTFQFVVIINFCNTWVSFLKQNDRNYSSPRIKTMAKKNGSIYYRTVKLIVEALGKNRRVQQ